MFAHLCALTAQPPAASGIEPKGPQLGVRGGLLEGSQSVVHVLHTAIVSPQR